jgi:peptidoglycan/xylan/chitin deacetylase (PgdA/CDA1 family)
MFVNLIKNGLVPVVFSRLRPSFLGSLVGVNPLIAYYHIVSDEDVPHVKHLYAVKTVDQFKKELDTFLQCYQMIGLRDLLDNLSYLRPLPSCALSLTFDDGFREIYDVIAPILLEKGVPATFFITTACLDNRVLAYSNKISVLIQQLQRLDNRAVEDRIMSVLSERGLRAEDAKTSLLRIDYLNKDVLDEVAKLAGLDFDEYLKEHKPYLTSEQVSKLIQMGFSIGAHSIDHPPYSLLPLDEQLRQTRTSVRLVRERFGLSYGAFAFPHGDGNVPEEYFQAMFAGGDVDVSFGTAGMLRGGLTRHFQRFSMEYLSAPAGVVLGHHYARGLYKRIIGRHGANKVRR